MFHTEQYSLLLDHLEKATTQSDRLVAICGADGCGKTTLLNKFLLSLGDDVCFARVDESYKGVREFYCEFLRQMGFHDIDGKPDELRRITREFVLNRGMAGEPVLLVIDNAHLISPFILEQLRWLSAIKVDEIRVLSCVLAGNSDLMRILDSNAMSQLAFNYFTRFHIRAFTEVETMAYVWSRLQFAGYSDTLSISDEAHPLIHRFSGGIPRLINILCDALLQEACSVGSTIITDEMLRSVAERRKLVPHVLPYQGQGRRKTDPDRAPNGNGSQPGHAASANGDASRQGQEFSAGLDAADPEHLSISYDTNALLRNNARLVEKLALLKNENSRYRLDVHSYNSKIEIQHAELQRQAARNDELTQLLEAGRREIDTLRQTLTAKQQSSLRQEESQRHLAGQLDELREESSQLREQLSDMASDTEAASRLQIELDRSEQRRTASDDEIAQLRSDISDAVEGIRVLERELESESTSREDTTQLFGEYESQIEKYRAHISDLESLAADHEQEVAALESKVETLECDLLASAEKLDDLASLEANVEDYRATITELEARLSQSVSSPGESSPDGAAVAAEQDDTVTVEPVAGDRVQPNVPIRTIEVFRNDQLERIIRLGDYQDRIMIGRGDDNDIVLDSGFISRHHAILSIRDDGSAFIEDLNSLNGIVVNKAKLARADLGVGDVLIIGDFCLLPGPA